MAPAGGRKYFSTPLKESVLSLRIVGVNLDRMDWRALAIRHLFRAGPMAREAGVSLRTVERTFHRRYGCNVRAQFKVWRREHAAELLRVNRFRMKEIGATLGYANGSAFARACREWTGGTPKQFEARLVS